MKTYIKPYLFVWVLLTAGLASCSDYFNPDQDLGLKKEDHWDTHEEVRRSIIGAYSRLQPLVEELVVMGSLRGDLLTVTENYDPYLNEINRHGQLSTTNPYADPRGFYEVIKQCNEVLGNMEKAKADPKFTEEIHEIYKAEVISLRAWVYYQLAMTYKEIPVVTDPLSGYDKNYAPERYDFEQTVNWLIKEMEVAAATLSPNWATFSEEFNLWDLIFINRKALLAELHLWAGNNERAATLLMEAVKEGEYFCNRNTSGGSNWTEFWNSNYSALSEKVTIIPFNAYDNQKNGFGKLFSFGASGDYLLRPTVKAIQDWQDDDRTSLDYRGYNRSYTFGPANQILVYKYFRSKDTENGVVRQDEELETDAPYCIYRAADLHLLYAEALNRAGRHREALRTVNERMEGVNESSGIRGRLHLSPINLLEFAGIDESDRIDSLGIISDVILAERAKELAFEGRRWNALMRFAVQASDPAVLADRVATKFEGSEADRVRTYLMNRDNWRLDFDFDKLDK
ncbi:hypothetical protein FUAX_07430 [Fulvitalea axinellae]|uniref:RagB/SusD family nutrient uptake outer membrane protein n=1 Tax=Fulvitalea axinellae TaxID=1182444 RepID=A0AAU9CHN6_9BACT|nr:hypothetical protein FUAX_07430 [Fulvitalea axinellae]